MNQPRLSLAMIVRDAESTLERVLGDAVGLCDEMIVVDTGSLDRTVEIAESLGASVFHFTWIDDFSAARNYAIEQCSGEWILLLDADDRIPQQAVPGFESIIADLPNLDGVDVIQMAYRTNFESPESDACISKFDRERIIRNIPELRWTGKIHEYIPHTRARAIYRSDAWVDHRPILDQPGAHLERNLQLLEESLAEGDRSGRNLAYYAATLGSLDRHHQALDLFEETLEKLKSSAGTEGLFLYNFYQNMARSAAALDMTERKLDLLARAILVDSTRAEAFVELGRHFYARKEWQRAMPFFAAAASLEAPVVGTFNPAMYTWLPWDYLAICAGEIGDFQSALDYTMRAISGHPEKERLAANLLIFAEHL